MVWLYFPPTSHLHRTPLHKRTNRVVLSLPFACPIHQGVWCTSAGLGIVRVKSAPAMPALAGNGDGVDGERVTPC